MRSGLTFKRIVTALIIVLLISVLKNWKDVKRGFIDGVNDGRAHTAKTR
ncbi:hypothetical protein [Mucilaginibacter aquatilis]|uniref:Uncharacterized protein n=1 Tax=Mucilaginibacter aquatilis TaxID=1517760 RepID=A0A6I4IQ18_9SPHI|nr:hypothetical protein [Mucilaginibacter aquatilis]MVN90983.1 hypothetical protein [Mucilaginibacter aquatilis]